jgi:mercuric ion transport protein
VMLAFPLYADIFVPPAPEKNAMPHEANAASMTVSISGMDCEACSNFIEHAVYKNTGIISVAVDYENEQAFVEFDQSQVEAIQVLSMIDSTGYTATRVEEKL